MRLFMKTNFVTALDHKRIYFDHYQNGFKKLVIIAHGFFNSRKAVLLKELGEILSQDYDVLLMDFRGHGQSEGLFYWTSKEYLDLQAIVQYARPQYEKIGVVGFSLGAATSLIVAAQTNTIDSLIAISAPAEFWKIEYNFWQLNIENDIMYSLFRVGRLGKGVRPGPIWLKKENPIDVVGKIQCPIFYIHGEADWLIKPWHSQELFEKTKSKKKLTIIKNGPHAEYLLRENKNREEVLKYIQEWFTQTLEL